ncbi:MAG TPA: hypothetical protein VMT89_17080, partial [Candidatus Acidoferrales bacterium]|nr:hypothetical protein [Candidatus Acidoferrales bacterium]
EAMLHFARRTLTGPGAARFLESFCAFQRRVAPLGMVNSLSQVVLKIASPGVPDFYQGSELWDLSLVDPDNRRPVDYALRKQMLTGMTPLLCHVSRSGDARTAAVREMLAQWPDGRIKMFVMATGLHLRRAWAELFLTGGYEPLEAAGTHAQHVLALARRNGEQSVIAAVPRLFSSLLPPGQMIPVGAEVWGDTILKLPSQDKTESYRNLFTGEIVDPGADGDERWILVASLLRTCPVALLASRRVRS